MPLRESAASVLFSATRCRVILLFGVRQQGFDSRRARDRVVFLELDLGRDAQAQPTCEVRTQVRRDAVQAVKGRLLLAVAAQHADVDTSMTEIGTDLGARHRHESNDSRILCRFSEKGRYLDADRFGDAVRSTCVTQTRQPPMSVCEQPAPS